MGSITIEYIAQTCHEANRVLQEALGEPVNPPWSETTEEMRTSAVDGVRQPYLQGSYPAHNHENWLKFKEAHGWKYGPVKNEEKKEHPCFVSYDQLPPEQKVKDHLFISIVRSLEELL